MDKIKEKLGTKGQALVRLCLWAGLIVWMIFYLAFGITIARWLGPQIVILMGDFWSPTYVAIMGWLVPIWFIFTILLTIILVSKWANKKIREG